MLEDHIEEGRAFGAEDRESGALVLQQVDEPDQVEVDVAWEETVNRRLEELKRALLCRSGQSSSL